jgi:hypothetical protein
LKPEFYDEEKTIKECIKNRISFLGGDSAVGYSGVMETTSNEDLGCRKAQIGIHYSATHAGVPFALTGKFQAYSNGLYLWYFESVDSGTSKKNIKSLVADYIEKIIKPLFGGNWNKEKASSGKNKFKASDYYSQDNSALSYHQFEILFDSIFNAEIDPNVFFRASNNEEINKEIYHEQKFGMHNIVDMLVLYHWKGNYEACCSPEIKYNVLEVDPGTSGESLNIIQSKLITHQKAERELLISRLCLTAMEHFVRCIVTSSIRKYRYGFDLVRYSFVRESIISKVAKAPRQILAPSLGKNKFSASSSRMEAFYTYLLSKYSLMIYTAELISDLGRTCKTKGSIQEEKTCYSEGTDEAANAVEQGKAISDELKKRKICYASAYGQLERYLRVIGEDIKVIESEYMNKKEEDKLYALSEIKKVNAVLAPSERNHSRNITSDISNKSMLFLTIMTAMIAWSNISPTSIGDAIKVYTEPGKDIVELLVRVVIALLTMFFLMLVIGWIWRKFFATRVKGFLVENFKFANKICTANAANRSSVTIEQAFRDLHINDIDYESLFEYFNNNVLAIDVNGEIIVQRTCHAARTDTVQEVGRERWGYTFSSSNNESSVRFELLAYGLHGEYSQICLTYMRYTGTNVNLETIRSGRNERKILSEYLRKIFKMDVKDLNEKVLIPNGLPKL